MPRPSEAEWASLASHMDTKVMGYLRCGRALLPSMRRAGWGRIINISGLGARRTGDVVGTIRNVAVVALAKNLADELAGTGITVTTVHPGLTRTEKVDAMLEARARAEGRSRRPSRTVVSRRSPDGLRSWVPSSREPALAALDHGADAGRERLHGKGLGQHLHAGLQVAVADERPPHSR